MIRMVFVGALLACALPGQVIFQNRSTSPGPNGEIQVVFAKPVGMADRGVTGAPYSADEVFEHTQTLADGTHISQNNPKHHLARDSQGRTRIEQPMMGVPAAANLPMLVQISDPVAGVAYILDEQNKVAHRVKLEPRVRTAPAAGGGTGTGIGGGGGSTVAIGTTGMTATASVIHPNRPEESSEQLGTQTIEGIVVDGARRTTIWPVNSHGNDRPVAFTTESWYSKELKVTVLAKSSDPRVGDNVTKLVNISRAEPDASLFQPPPDYKIVDDQDSVTLNLKRP